jgi:DNA repair protein SbcD/Mre11
LNDPAGGSLNGEWPDRFISRRMKSPHVRILFFADSHLGFDMPARPRVKRRRRGEDFFKNYRLIVDRALRDDIDLVVHGGDVFYRSKIPAELVWEVFEPLLGMADDNIPVLVVPGNHERSKIPFKMLTRHSNIYLFDSPKTVVLTLNGMTLALSGFPCERNDIRSRFTDLVEETHWQAKAADARFLCIHQAVDGACVGPRNFIFRNRRDVISSKDIPSDFTAVLSGHIHRSQILTRHMDGTPLPAPVLYPGSIERTSFAEQDEPKGYLILDVSKNPETEGCSFAWNFVQLPARPMVSVTINADGLSELDLEVRLNRLFASLDPNAVVSLRISNSSPEHWTVLRADMIRRLAPPSMNVTATPCR